MIQAQVNVGEIVLHHTADASQIDFDFYFWDYTVHLPHWNDVHLGPVAVNLSPTKHVVFMLLAAFLVFFSMWLTGRKLKAQRADRNAPTGFANAMEAFVIFVRDDIAIAGVGKEMGAKYAPFIMSIFFFILYCNLLGLIPYGASPTGNLAITGALAFLSFIAIEVGGIMKLGMGGYMRTIFPKVPGMSGAPAMAMTVAMAPIEILGKLVKPFALAVRLFGNITAGHFVILSLFGIIFLFGHLQIWNWAIGLTTAGLVTLIMLLELFIAFLQAYVFALLTATFIGLMQHEH